MSSLAVRSIYCLGVFRTVTLVHWDSQLACMLALAFGKGS